MKRMLSKASKVATGPLTTTEMWELGQAIAGKVDRKISGRLDLAWGAGKWSDDDDRRGLAIPSKNGKLLIGSFMQPKTAVEVKAAPGTGKNPLFTLYHRKGTTDHEMWGVRFAATAPVRWKVQKQIRIREPHARGAVWTPGLAYTELLWYYRATKRGAVLAAGSELTEIDWVLGFDAGERPVCMLFACRDATLFSRIGGQVLATPTADELAALRAQPHRLAMTETELVVLATAIAKSGTKKARRPDRKWKGMDVSEQVRLAFAGREVARVPSVNGELCLGNVRDPKRAIRLELGGADNLSLELRLKKGLAETRKRVLDGVTLSSEPPVRWRREGTFARGRAWSSSRTYACVGLWSPGLERTAPEHFKGTTSPIVAPGLYAWDCDAAISRLAWYVGYDAEDRPAVLLVGDARAEVAFERAVAALDYTKERAKVALSAVVTARRENARLLREAKKREAEEEAAADAPAPPATAEDLLAIGAAIAAGPRKRGRITDRFSMSWHAKPIPTVDRELYVGDPSAAWFPLAAGEGAKAAFSFHDAKGADDGRAIIGLRLGDGPAVQWKVGIGLGVDSGRYGVWSPGFPTDDPSFGLSTSRGLVAMILSTLDGDCSFPSMLGLDANQQPVAFLFGEAVDPAVFKAARRPLA